MNINLSRCTIYISLNPLKLIYILKPEVKMSLDKEIIGKKIRQIRKERGISQEKLSEEIDISPRQMCMIESGNSYPSIETFVKISKILDIDINNFFNLNVKNSDNLRSEIYDLINICSVSELYLLKDIIKAIHKNRK